MLYLKTRITSLSKQILKSQSEITWSLQQTRGYAKILNFLTQSALDTIENLITKIERIKPVKEMFIMKCKRPF
jgi:hypothetical protein